MATKTWRGDAQPIAQVTTITIGGAAGAGDVIKITCNLKNISITLAGTETTTDVATALLAALVSATQALGEFSRISFTSATNVVTATSNTPGYPFTITKTVTLGAGSITATLATPTASKGASHWGDVNNWGGSALPTTNDSIIVPDGCPNYPLWDADALAAVDLGTGSINWLGGTGGLSDYNPDGYLEYRAKSIELGGCAAINIGNGVTGTTFLRLKVNGSATIPTKIDNGQALSASVSAPGVYLTSGGTASLTVSIVSGAAALAVGTGDAVTVGSLKIGTGGPTGSIGASDEAAACWIGTGATVTTTILNAGDVIAEASTALTIYGGVYTQKSGNIGAISNYGGTVVFNSSGTIGAVTNLGPDALLDMSGDVRAITSITSLSCTEGGYFYDPQGRIPTSTAVATDDKSYPKIVWKIGACTLTRT